MFWHRTAIKLHRLNVPICISRCCMHLHTNSCAAFSLFFSLTLSSFSLSPALLLSHTLTFALLCETQLPLPNANCSQVRVNKKSTTTCIHTRAGQIFKRCCCHPSVILWVILRIFHQETIALS